MTFPQSARKCGGAPWGALCVLLVLLLSCGEPPKTSDLVGRWLHTLDREGYDFSPDGLCAHYSLAPQSVQISKYSLDDGRLWLRDPQRRSSEPESLPAELEVASKLLRLQMGPRHFKNYRPPPEDAVDPPADPAILGLWKDNGGTEEFWNFTPWGTVFGRVATDPGKYEGLWARYRIPNSTQLQLWGVHGEKVLDGKPWKLKLSGGSLELRGKSFVKLDSPDKL